MSDAGVKSIDMGRVVATIESSGKRQTVGTTILKLRPVPVKPSDLEYHLNTLMATYSDPMDIVRVAQDLASRCKAEISPTLPSEPQEPAAPKDSKGAKRSKSVCYRPRRSFCIPFIQGHCSLPL